MTKEDILATLLREKNHLQKEYGVEKIGLFGSCSRGEATSQSDIDIYVELKENSFRKLASLWNYLEDLYGGIKVDMVNKHRHAKSEIFKSIQQETIYI